MMRSTHTSPQVQDSSFRVIDTILNESLEGSFDLFEDDLLDSEPSREQNIVTPSPSSSRGNSHNFFMPTVKEELAPKNVGRKRKASNASETLKNEMDSYQEERKRKAEIRRIRNQESAAKHRKNKNDLIDNLTTQNTSLLAEKDNLEQELAHTKELCQALQQALDDSILARALDCFHAHQDTPSVSPR